MGTMQKALQCFIILMILCIVASISAVVISTKTAYVPHHLDPESCPEGYEDHPLIIVSMDGFKPDYFNRGITPTLNDIRDTGVKTEYMKSTYPTLTFPNHYTMVTGLYPESHGIIANQFYDPEFHAQFKMGNNESLDGKWWGGEPIWNTLTKQGKKSATLFWPGSEADIEGMHPTYWFNYTDDMSFSDRVYQVLDWIQLPKDQRPSWISLYFNEPDHTAHGEGPNSMQINEKIAEVDYAITTLMIGLRDLKLTSCVNLLFVSDHGGATSSPETIIHLDDYIPDLYDKAFFYGGAFSRINPSNKDDTEGIIDAIACEKAKLQAYKREDLPNRMHFYNNRRIEDIVLDLYPGYTANLNSNWTLKGNHGYDNYYYSMNAVFFAYGPDMKLQYTIPPFQNIQLYNFMCALLGVEPAPNNGTKGALYDIVNVPMPEYPQPEGELPEQITFPETPDGRFNVSHCSGDITLMTDWIEQFNFTSETKSSLEHTHSPFGVPLSGNVSAVESLVLLHQQEFITGYSPVLKMPLWISGTIKYDTNASPDLTEWYSDVRLDEDSSQTCEFYQNLEADNITMYPLFPARFLHIGSAPINRASVISNAVPISNQNLPYWTYLIENLVTSWLQYSPHGFNIIIGPIFDDNHDSLPDNSTDINSVPSDFFAIITRCTNIDILEFADCPESDLDARAFILPQYMFRDSLCGVLQNNAPSFFLEYSCRVQDVEIATGFTFFYDKISPKTSIDLKTRVHDELWPIRY